MVTLQKHKANSKPFRDFLAAVLRQFGTRPEMTNHALVEGGFSLVELVGANGCAFVTLDSSLA